MFLIAYLYFFGIIIKMFMKEIINNLKLHLKESDTIIVACSTGPDSMCLVSLIMSLNIKLNIIIAHVNHKVRLQSDEEYEYLENYCKENNLMFEGLILNNLSTKNFEANARSERYKFFKELKEKYNAKYILTAHHGDDQIETILMRIIRGSNLSGYAGIKLIDKDFYRPLLLTDKEHILVYLKENNIKYYVDVTNDEDSHTRNKLRHHVLPFFKKYSNITNKFIKFSNELNEYDNFVKDYINNNKLISNNIIDLNKLNKESTFIQRKTIELLISDIQAKDLLDISDNVTKEILNIINSDKPNVQINLNNGYIFIKEYNKGYIIKQNINKETYEIFNNLYEDENYIIKKNNTLKSDNFTLRLDSNDIKLPLIIRTRQSGDKIEMNNLGHKKIKDILIDEKVPKNERDNILLVTDSNNEILWIVGLKKSKFDKPINKKYDIILTGERKR